jgi:hypothetical protein
VTPFAGVSKCSITPPVIRAENSAFALTETAESEPVVPDATTVSSMGDASDTGGGRRRFSSPNPTK